MVALHLKQKGQGKTKKKSDRKLKTFDWNTPQANMPFVGIPYSTIHTVHKVLIQPLHPSKLFSVLQIRHVSILQWKKKILLRPSLGTDVVLHSATGAYLLYHLPTYKLVYFILHSSKF